jgi:hypothetical protein
MQDCVVWIIVCALRVFGCYVHGCPVEPRPFQPHCASRPVELSCMCRVKSPEQEALPAYQSCHISIPLILCNRDIPFTNLLADKRKLPTWRYSLRQSILPLIRWETPYLAWMQDKMRSPTLDTYFAITANLGTHTFFMVVLPILFWCGHTALGRG